MEITFPNPSTPRHDRNPKRRINYGLSGQRELADQGQSWHRSILDLVPRLNKYLRTFGDWGRTEIDEVHLWIFPESDGRWYLGEGFCALLHLIFATDKEVMNPKWRLASRINKHLDFSWGSNTQEEHWTSLLFIQKVKMIDKNIFLFISWLFNKASETRLMSIYFILLSFYSLTIDRIQWSGGVEIKVRAWRVKDFSRPTSKLPARCWWIHWDPLNRHQMEEVWEKSCIKAWDEIIATSGIFE